MKKIVVLAILGALALAVPAAQAVEYVPAPPPKEHKPPKGHGKGHGKSHKCQPHSVGYNATGTLIASSLSAQGKDRYSGTLEVQVNRANHRGLTGEETFTLTSAKVFFHHGVDAQSPAVGSRVKLHGKVTQLAKKCPSEGFTPAVTVRKVDIRQAKQP
jgi:hypothetical protein